MKPSTPDILRRQLIPFSLLIALTALIWLGWPQLASAPPVINRLYLTAAIYLTWMLKMIFVDLSPSAHSATSKSPELQKKLGLLEGRLTGVLRFLRKTPLIHNGIHTNFSVLPWHLLIGPKDAGKTSLLAHSGMRFVLSKKFPDGVAPSTSTDWWVTRELVLTDVPGSWFQSGEKPSMLWQGFLDLVQRKAASRLNSVTLALHLPELMQTASNVEWERITETLRNQIENLRNTLGHQLPFYLIITKCDLLPGFTTFFRDSSREELSNAWGITLPRRQPEEKLQDVICSRFNSLIKQLNSQLVLRLHQERNSQWRPLIKDFPIQVERLRDQVLKLIGMIAPDLPLRGIWLTSATQNADHPCEIQGMTASLALQTPSLVTAPPEPARPYFIRQVIQHGLPGWSGQT